MRHQSAAGITSSLTQTLVIPLIRQPPTFFHAQSSVSAWAVTVTSLTGVVGMPILGKPADPYGKRWMPLIALIPMVLFSIQRAMSARR